MIISGLTIPLQILCHLATASAEDRFNNPLTAKQNVWQHRAGHSCFQLDVLQDLPQLFSLRLDL